MTDTGARHRQEQAALDDYGADGLDLSPLSERERDVVEAVILGDQSVRGWQRDQELTSPGTVQKLLQRARRKVPELRQLQAGEGRP